MAGEPAPLASVQAAVMKSAAGAAAQAPPSQAVSLQNNAINRDLSVMADQAAGYTKGVNIGNSEAAANRSAQSNRLAQEAAQAAQMRANELESQRLELAQQQQRMAIEAAGGQMDLAKARTANEGVDEEALYAQRKDAVFGHAMRNRTEGFVTQLNDVVSTSTNYHDAVARMDNLVKQGYITENVPAMRAYLRQIFNKAAQGKEPDLDALTPRQKAAASAAGGGSTGRSGPSLTTGQLRQLTGLRL